MKRMNRVGILRLLEVFFAIILILGSSLYLISKNNNKNYESENIIALEKGILQQIAENTDFRNEIISKSEEDTMSTEMQTFVSARLPPNYLFEILSCELESLCPSTDYHQVIYAQERVISSSLDSYNPKKIKLYVWPKEE